jgi:hypothetical protein
MRASTTGKTFRWKNPPKSGCDRWNVYMSRGKKGLRAVIDTQCKYCDRRVKFQWSRRNGRGRPRPVLFYSRPETMTAKALLEEVRSRNRLQEIEEAVEGFVKASELR